MKLIFIDIETTGLDPFLDLPLDICVKVVDAKTFHEDFSFSSLISYDKELLDTFDDIGAQFHGLSKEDLNSGMPAEEVQKVLLKYFKDAGLNLHNSVFFCQNPSFDRPFFYKIINSKTLNEIKMPYHWLDLASMFWAFQIMQKLLNFSFILSKDNIARHLGLDPEFMPHRAERGVDHLIKCYKAMVDYVSVG